MDCYGIRICMPEDFIKPEYLIKSYLGSNLLS